MMTILELVKAMKGANREKLYRLAKENPDLRCWYRGSFLSMLPASGTSGVLSDPNFAEIDFAANLAGAWRRASHRAWR